MRVLFTRPRNKPGRCWRENYDRRTTGDRPGTYQTGIALFEDGKLVDWKVITVNRGVEIEDRINNIVEWLEVYVQRQGVDIRQVAIEKPMGIDAHRPAPELQVLVRRLRRWART